ncbi:nucleotide-binding protein [candidate division KSB1 bacterium]|nr:nucleotide-binding protein [candidate division KSB1 bacterium]
MIVTGTKNDFVKNIRQSFTSIKVNNFFFKKEDTRLHFIKFVSDALKDIDGTASADAEQGKPSRSIDNNKIFIGHGHSSVWRELKDFLQDDLQLEYEEFDRKSVAGKTVTKRLEEMLDDCNFALIILTAEDPHDDGRLHARENVIYELGLFQGRLGMDKAIILLEDGCKEFSNISGQIQIRFSQGNISAVFHKIEKVLKREKII